LRQVNDGVQLPGQATVLQGLGEVVLDPIRDRKTWGGSMPAKSDDLDIAWQVPQQVTANEPGRARDQDAPHNCPPEAYNISKQRPRNSSWRRLETCSVSSVRGTALPRFST
jgi:hypothetical protein